MQTQERPSRQLWLQVSTFTLLRVVVNTAFRMVYPLLPAFRDGLGISFTQLSRALTFRALAGVFGPFIAVTADRRGRKTGMLLGVGLFTAGATAVIISPTFPGFILSLLLIVLGKFAFDPAMQAFLGDRVPYQRRAFVLAFTEIGWSGATLLGIPLAALLIRRAGWISIYPFLAVLGLFFFAALFFLLPGDPKVERNRPGIFSNLGTVFSSRAAVAGLLVTLFLSWANEIINLVFATWLEQSFALQITALGSASIVLGLAELGGEGLMGTLTDRIGKRRAVTWGLLANSLAGLLLPWLGRTLAGAFIGLFLFYLAFEFSFVSTIPLMTELLPKARASLMAVNIASASLGRAFAALITPAIFAGGFGWTAAAAAGINLLGWLALRQVRLPEEN